MDNPTVEAELHELEVIGGYDREIGSDSVAHESESRSRNNQDIFHDVRPYSLNTILVRNVRLVTPLDTPHESHLRPRKLVHKRHIAIFSFNRRNASPIQLPPTQGFH